ncbi:Ribonuclease III, partial [hydrothermal vent metagenome]
DHEKTFTVQVWISDEPYGVGVGKTKKEAEQSAAMKTYESMVENEADSASE